MSLDKFQLIVFLLKVRGGLPQKIYLKFVWLEVVIESSYMEVSVAQNCCDFQINLEGINPGQTKIS